MSIKIHPYRLSFFCLVAVLLFASCKSTPSEDLISHYRIAMSTPIDSSEQGLSKARKASDWILSLEDKNNFHLYGTDIDKVGYWRIENNSNIGQGYRLLLQSGDYITYADVKKDTIRFAGPTGITDNIFKDVKFVRVKD